MESLTLKEFLDQLPTTNDPKEQIRREHLHAEREAELELVVPGLCLFGIKNKETKEYRFKTALSVEDACHALGWDPSIVRALPLDVGKVKPPMPPEIKVVLKARTEEKKKENIVYKEKTHREGPTLKHEMLDLFKANPGATKEELSSKIYTVLQRRTGSTDEAHLKNRTNLSYYFYRKEWEKQNEV